MQYADFLRLALDKVTYRDLMPPLAHLLDPDKYGLEPAVAFLLYRPVLSRVPFPAPPSAKDEEDGEIPEGDQVPMEVEQGETTTCAGPDCIRSMSCCPSVMPCCTSVIQQSCGHRPYLVTTRIKPCGIITCKASLQMQHDIWIKLYSIVSQVLYCRRHATFIVQRIPLVR